MRTLKLLLLVALVFLAGVVVGVVGTRIVVRRVVAQAMNHPEAVQYRIEHNLAFRLRLDRNQRGQLHDILSNARDQLRDLRQQYRPKAVLVVSNANSRIAAILTPEQQARFEEWKRENHPFLGVVRPNPTDK